MHHIDTIPMKFQNHVVAIYGHGANMNVTHEVRTPKETGQGTDNDFIIHTETLPLPAAISAHVLWSAGQRMQY
jgi:hypothetical protein